MAKNDPDMRAAALTENIDLNQLCDLLMAKLREKILGQLPSKQRVVGSESLQGRHKNKKGDCLRPRNTVVDCSFLRERREVREGR